MVEAFLSKIISVLIKKAIASTVIKTIATIFEVYTVIDTINDALNIIETSNDCDELGLFGVKVASDYLTTASFDKIVQVGNEKFTVERTKSGIYVASKFTPIFKLEEVSGIDNLFNSSKFIHPFSNNSSGNFREVNDDVISGTLRNRFRELDD